MLSVWEGRTPDDLQILRKTSEKRKPLKKRDFDQRDIGKPGDPGSGIGIWSLDQIWVHYGSCSVCSDTPDDWIVVLRLRIWMGLIIKNSTLFSEVKCRNSIHRALDCCDFWLWFSNLVIMSLVVHLFGRALREIGFAVDRQALRFSVHEIFQDTFTRHRPIMPMWQKVSHWKNLQPY